MDTSDATTVGQRLRLARQARTLSQLDLAARADVSLTTVAAIERGITRWPHMATLQPLAAVLGVSARWLRYGGDDVSVGS